MIITVHIKQALCFGRLTHIELFEDKNALLFLKSIHNFDNLWSGQNAFVSFNFFRNTSKSD